jgi:hypothetical protein
MNNKFFSTTAMWLNRTKNIPNKDDLSIKTLFGLSLRLPLFTDFTVYDLTEN